MGWWPFSSSSSSSNPRAEAIRTGAEVPTRAERLQCWSSRDAYFACLDRHSIRDPETHPRACPDESRLFERDCAAAWVSYFKKWRVAEARKRETLEALRKEGAKEMPLQPTFDVVPEGKKGSS